ncbi:MAG: hypothetical protein WDW38_010929 [Sanguina aurantia]
MAHYKQDLSVVLPAVACACQAASGGVSGIRGVKLRSACAKEGVNHVIDAKTIASLDAEVFIAGVTQSLTDGAVQVSLNCSAVSAAPFPSYQPLIDKGYSYQLSRPSVAAYNETPGDVVIDSHGSLSDPVLRRFTYSHNSTIWSMQVSPQAGWQPGWLAGFQVIVVAFAVVNFSLLGITLLAWRSHQVLLEAVVPKGVLQQLRREHLDGKAPPFTQAGSAAALITTIMDQLLEGVQPSTSDVLAVRTVVSRAVNIYRPFDLAKRMQATLDDDVAAALLSALGGEQSGPSTEGPFRLDPTELTAARLSAAERSVQGTMLAVCVNETGQYEDLRSALVALLSIDTSARGPDIRLPSLRHSYDPGLNLYQYLSSSTPGTSNPKPHSPHASKPPPADLVPSRRDKQHPPLSLALCEFSTMLQRMGSGNSYARPVIHSSSAPRGSLTGSPSVTSMDSPRLRPFLSGSAARRRSITARAALELPLMEEVERCLFASDAWQYDIFELESATDGHALSTLAFYLFQKAGLLQHFKLDGPSLVRFLRAVEDKYRRNPYHCAAHAADVLQSFAVLLDRGGLLVPGDALTLLGCYIAAVVHDLEHVGHTNDFLVKTGDKLAVVYNDISPLENHHLAATFTLLRQPGLDFLAGSNLGKQEQVQLRKLIIELVLASDMSKHFEIVATFQTTFGVTAQAEWWVRHWLRAVVLEPPPAAAAAAAAAAAEVAGGVGPPGLHPAMQGSSAARTLALKVRGGPLRSRGRWPARPWHTHRLGSTCADGAGHRAARDTPWMPCMSHRGCDACRQLHSFPELRARTALVGFFDFVAVPLFNIVAQTFPSLAPVYRGLIANRSYWKESAVKA